MIVLNSWLSFLLCQYHPLNTTLVWFLCYLFVKILIFLSRFYKSLPTLQTSVLYKIISIYGYSKTKNCSLFLINLINSPIFYCKKLLYYNKNNNCSFCIVTTSILCPLNCFILTTYNYYHSIEKQLLLYKVLHIIYFHPFISYFLID